MKINIENIKDLNKGGIYKIVNTINKKLYIGSTKSFKTRINHHLTRLRRNKHKTPHLQRAWNKYGEDCFEFLILEVCEESLIEKEKYFITTLNSCKRDFGYNTNCNPELPCSFMQEVRDKISNTLKQKYKDGTLLPNRSALGKISKRKGCKIKDTSNFKKPKTRTDKLKQTWEKSKIIGRNRANNVEVYDKNYNLLYTANSIMDLKEWSLTEDNNLPLILRGNYSKKLDQYHICKSCKSGKMYKGLYFKSVTRALNKEIY